MTGLQSPKIFCTGLSRTGTTALCAALETFGLQTIHWPIHLFAQSEALGLPPFRPALRLGPYAAWRRRKEIKAYRARHDARWLLETHDAFGDLPVPLYYRELAGMFPGSLFIHTTRRVEGWLQSMEWLFEQSGVLWRRGRLADELHQRIYGTTRFDSERLREAFFRHEESVGLFLREQGARGLSLRIDSGEMTYERLAGFLEIASDRTGPVPRSNEARTAGASARRDFLRDRVLFPFRLVFRRLARNIPVSTQKP
jgi:hypothetical protein